MTTPAQAPYPNRKTSDSTKTTISPIGGRASSAGRPDDKFDVQIESSNISSWKKLLGVLLIAGTLSAGYYAWHVKSSRASAGSGETPVNQTAAASPTDFSVPAPSKTVPTPAADVDLVHGLLKLRDVQAFTIDVPAHIIRPHIHGQFRTVGSGGKVDLLLMDEQQYDDFTQHRPNDWIQGQTDAASADVDWLLHPTVNDVQKYYLVFASSERGGSVTVKANFTLSLE